LPPAISCHEEIAAKTRDGCSVWRLNLLICDRSFELARRVVPICDRMAASGFSARHVAGQLIKATTSISAHAHEAQEGQTKPDFIAKMSVARKEARETHFWLRFAVAAEIVRAELIEWELREAHEILRMIRSAIKTAQSRPNRTPPPPQP
jgi:four helix bundle protein